MPLDSSLRITAQFENSNTQRFIGWRCMHNPDFNPPNMPSVRPSHDEKGDKTAPPIQFTEAMQWLSWQLMSHLNSTISKKQWGAVYDGDRAYTNFNGWDSKNKPNDQRRDYVQDRYRDFDDPKLMDAIIMAGSFYRGMEKGDLLWMYPGIHAIDANKPMPNIQTILDEVWYFASVNNTKNPSHFAQGNGYIVAVPYFLREPVSYPVSWFARWDSDELPDPLYVYA